MIPLTLIVAIVAMTLFGIATPVHHERRIGVVLLRNRQRRLRILASGLVVLAFATAIAGRGWAFGPPLWLGMLMVGAGVVFLALNLLPIRRSAPIGEPRISDPVGIATICAGEGRANGADSPLHRGHDPAVAAPRRIGNHPEDHIRKHVNIR